MKAAVLRGIKNIQIENIEEPVIQNDNDVLVEVKSVGICGSDVHYYLHGRIGNQIVKEPHILGHEVAGKVVEVGRNVETLVPGTPVAVEPGIPCGRCEHCRQGRYNICPDMKFLGTPPVPGGYRNYLVYPSEFLHPIPESMSFGEGALIETLVVGMYAVELSELKPCDDIAILGCGPIGLCTLKSAVSAGVGRIFVSDLIDERLQFAKKYDNVIPINAKRENVVKIIKELTNNRGVDIVFEAAGTGETFRQSIELVRIGGKVIWIGIPAEDYISLDVHTARRKEVVIKSVRRFKHNYPRSIRMVESGKIVLKDMITHEFELKDIEQAFRLVENYSDGVMKAIIKIV